MNADGSMTKDLPFDLCNESQTVKLEEVKGWQTDLEGVTTKDAMPKALQEYLELLEKELECKISIVSTGPERDKIIYMN